ncbi:MAG: hypothetical protein ACMUHM_09425 [Thermoplasmatota archaeon]
MEETVINTADRIQMWTGEKPGLTMWDSFVGRLVLTDRRLLFLSTGDSGMKKRISVSMFVGWIPGLFLGEPKTKDLDLLALGNKGSLSIDLKDIRSFEVKRRKDLAYYISFVKENFIGQQTSYSFMTRYGFKRKWLDRFREDLLKAKEMAAGGTR